jgi:hypothetical protein
MESCFRLVAYSALMVAIDAVSRLKIIYSDVSDGQMSNESNEEDISTVDAYRTQK